MAEHDHDRLIALVVLRREGQWMIDIGGKLSSPFPSRASAIQAAIKRAHRLGRSGKDTTQVLLQRENGTFERVWTYGRDPFPRGIGKP